MFLRGPVAPFEKGLVSPLAKQTHTKESLSSTRRDVLSFAVVFFPKVFFFFWGGGGGAAHVS